MGTRKDPPISEPTTISVLLRTLLNAAPDAMVVAGATGRMVFVNELAQRMFGYKEEELTGQSIEVLVPPALRERHVFQRTAYVQQSPLVRPMGAGLDLRAVRKDGSEFPVEISLSPVQTDHGLMVVSAIRDITERHHVEEKIRSLNEQLQRALVRSESLASTGRLAATIAHEINNPLEALGNIFAILKQDPMLKDESRKLIQLGQEEIARASNIVRQVLAPHREPLKPTAVDVAAVLGDVLSAFEARLARVFIRVTRDIQAHPVLAGSPGKLRQVFTNLIANAYDAMQPMGKGELRLAVEADHDRAIVRIGDSGPGIAQADLGNLFQPFFTTKAERGTGIGLWVTRSLVAEMGGEIDVQTSTDPGRSGTTFTVTLPLAAPSGPQR